ncbi:hypothetical protein F5888DRAFT_1706651, partial [Russula emetica]
MRSGPRCSVDRYLRHASAIVLWLLASIRELLGELNHRCQVHPRSHHSLVKTAYATLYVMQSGPCCSVDRYLRHASAIVLRFLVSMEIA